MPLDVARRELDRAVEVSLRLVAAPAVEQERPEVAVRVGKRRVELDPAR